MLKRFLVIFMPVAALLAVILLLVFQSEKRAEISLIKTQATNHIKLQNKTITTMFRNVVSDLLYLSEQRGLIKLLDKSKHHNMSEISANYTTFMARKQMFDQIRYIDNNGLEIIRVNLNDGEPNIVSNAFLQNKGNRYYFKETISLDRGEIFVSPFDLNMENKKIEYPIKPVIRFATPVFNSKGEKRGIIIINFLGAGLIDDIQNTSGNYVGDIHLLNSDSYWLTGPKSRNDWGFMFISGLEITFKNYHSEAWKIISTEKTGQFKISDGLFTFCTVYPLTEARLLDTGDVAKNKGVKVVSNIPRYQWKLVSIVENSVLVAFTELKFRLIALYLILVAFIAIGSLYIARANRMRSKSEESLRTLSNTLEQAKEMVMITNMKGVIEYVNPATIETTGYSSEELIGATPSILKSGKHDDAFYQKMWEALNQGEIWTGEVINKKKWGELYYAESTISPVINAEGKTTHFASIQRDVTTRRRIEKKLMESERNLRNHVLKIENALSRTGEVQRHLASSPRIMPYFITSLPYRNYKLSGGGDSIRCLTFTSKYSAILLHDVSGHDIEELLLNILTTSLSEKHKMVTERKSISLPSIFLNGMNMDLKKFCEKTGHYVTAVYTLLDFENRFIQISLAGHPRQWFISPDGAAKQVGEHGLMMGTYEISYTGSDKYIDTSLKINAGELLLLYSDGLMEQYSRDGVMFSQVFEKSVIKKLAGLGPDQAYDILKEEFERHLDGRAADDDISFLFIGARPADKYVTGIFFPTQQLVVSLLDKAVRNDMIGSKASQRTDDLPEFTNNDLGGNIINNISDSYIHLTADLKDLGWNDEIIGRVESVLNEIVENAITHGNMYSEKRSIKLEYIIHDQVLEVSVTDEGYGPKYNRLSSMAFNSEAPEVQNRGFHLISAQADEVYFSEAGKTIWVMFDNR